MPTVFPKQGEPQHEFYLVDVKGKVLGRAAARIAHYLRGKEKVNFTPNADMGNFVIVVNAKDVMIKGAKWEREFYAKHTNYPSGLKIKSLRQMFEKDPTRVFYLAVKGMMPKNALGDKLLKRLRVYPDEKHEHEAQKPSPLTI